MKYNIQGKREDCKIDNFTCSLICFVLLVLQPVISELYDLEFTLTRI